MRKLSAFFLSLLTIVGGHILNRRADKALLFFSLLLVTSLLNLFLYPLLSITGGGFLLSKVTYYPQLLPISIVTSLGLVAFVSAIVSYLDAGHPPEGSTLTLPAIIGGLLSILIVFPVGGYMATYASINLKISNQISETEGQDGDESQPIVSSDNGWIRSLSGSGSHFWHNVRYSFDWTSEEALMPLPKGDAFLSGRMDYNGTPAVGVTLTGIFNGQFISDEVTTDSDGTFTFRVPAGDWRLNRIHTKTWSNKPAGQSFTLTGSVYTTLTERLYHEGPEYGSGGLALIAKPEPQIDPQLLINIQDQITLEWPNQEGMPASLTEDNISWHPVADASNYQIQLQHIEREGSTTTYSPVYWMNTDTTSLPLAQIQTTSAAEGSTNEYQVVVHAFDGTGRILTSSPAHHPMYSIEIEDRQIPSMQRFPSLRSDTPAITEEDIEQMQEEEKLIDAAMVLVEADMPAPARKLMGKLASNHQEKRRDTLEGLILTAEGQCDAARLHFETINIKWERDCLPDFYKQRCPSNQQAEGE
ncbi:MAG: carboxypeptidase-like regulatory domain-containing protein [Candidatus Thiodiazotropha sp. (ex Myrtea spinifera)]|nr:carboxypeptidase-like regulatory domain-containing protein [Candidatus Thiodiazotropha sp. (ex Myrtea spinifera)]